MIATLLLLLLLILFHVDSWWRLFDRFRIASNMFWIMPSGALLRTYGKLMFGPWAIPYIDMLYFWPTNVDPQASTLLSIYEFKIYNAAEWLMDCSLA